MIVLTVTLAALTAWLVVVPPPEPRLGRLLSHERPPTPDAAPRRIGVTVVATVSAAAAAWLLIGGPVGVVVSGACAIAVPRLTGRMESRADRTRREVLERQAPLAADLVAAIVASGATMQVALAAVGTAVGEPMLGALRPVVAAMELGADPVSAWQAVSGSPVLAPVRDAVVRTAESGAPLSHVLARIAEDMRRDRQVVVEVAARSAGVRAVAPLAACFLPAFILVGVVPVVASLAGDFLGT